VKGAFTGAVRDNPGRVAACEGGTLFLAEIGDHLPLEAIEENHIRRVIASTHFLQAAADILGIDQATLWRKRKRYGI
jgi:transcriptional regulator with PAS, ATPase and Fis domain